MRIIRKDCADRMDGNRWTKTAGIINVQQYGCDQVKAEAVSEV
jgi:hypothetical protein